MIDVPRLRWESAVNECRIHTARLRVAMTHVTAHMPLDPEKLDAMRDEDRAWMDQFLYRFSKLQDAIGERVFVDGLLLLGEDFRDRPFLDALNRLESLRFIRTRAWWQELRELRNQIAHEYPDRREEQAAAVNGIFVRCEELVNVFEQFVAGVESKALFKRHAAG